MSGGCRVVDELSVIFDISYTLESSLELREVIRPVLLKMADGLGMKRGTITILNREDGTASISEAVGLPSGQSQQDYLLACRDLVQQVIRSGLAIVVPDISKEIALKPRWQQEQQNDPNPQVAAYICVPIKFGEEVIGALSVERILDGRVRLSSDRRLLSLIANVIAHTVHFHRLTHEKLESLQRENERLQQQIQTSFRPPNIIGNSDAMRRSAERSMCTLPRNLWNYFCAAAISTFTSASSFSKASLLSSSWTMACANTRPA